MRKFEDNLMSCDCCGKMVDETTTSSCSLGGVEVTEYLPNLGKDRLRKLCVFNDQFYCKECMEGNICKSCASVLTNEEKAILKEKLD